MIIKFKEQQKFTQWWLWVILIVIGFLPIIGIYKQLIIGENFGSKPMTNIELGLVSLLVFGVIALFWLIKLETEINSNEIRMRFFPFIKKKVLYKDIKNAKVVNYGFVGGWGIRLWTAYGTVYNIKGNKGLAIELLNGEKFLIGTQKENELKIIVEKAFR
jgi:hypothetical protein